MPTYLDNTSISSYKECPRKYYLRHVLHWRKEGLAMPLAFGLAWHNAMDAVWKGAPSCEPAELTNLAMLAFLEEWEAQGLTAEPDLDDTARWGARTPSIAHEMIKEYIAARWRTLVTCELIAVEQPFAVPFPDLPNVWYIGRLDKVAKIAGEQVVVEHKTSSAYSIAYGFQTDFVYQWYMDSQVKGYQYSAALFFPGTKQVWVDAALVHKKVHNTFKFIPIAHQQPILEEWIADTKQWIDRILTDVDKSGMHPELPDYAGVQLPPGVFPRNEGACFGKYGACPYVDICRTRNNPVASDLPPGYIVEEWRPFELLGLDKIIAAQP